MKKLYLILLSVFICSVLLSQSKALYLSETFDDPGFPSGWEILSWGTDYWEISNSNQAGGQPNEISMMWVPALTGTTGRLGSPIIDLSNHSGTLIIEFQYLVMNMGECILGVATTSDNGNTWNVVYEEESPQYPSPIEYKSIEIDNADLGSENFRFCFFFHSDESGMATKRWLIDNVLLYSLVDYDAQLLSIDGIGEATSIGNNEIAFTFVNKGEETITSLEASYQFEGFDLVSEVFNSLSVAQDESFSLIFSDKTSLNEINKNYSLTVSIDKINDQADQEPANNIVNMNVHTFMALAEQRLVIDHFTSSTCAPCPAANEAMSNFLNTHSNKTVISKYQMNWPGTGDPYYNADGALRKAYYAVAGVPAIFFNGNELSTFNFEEFYNFYSLKQMPVVEIRGAFNIEETTINVDFNITAYNDLDDVAVHVCVNEKHTTGNVGNNGETDFYHVMMKMLPDGNGTSTNFDIYETQHFSFEYNLSSTFVEEYDDLEVVVFVQNKANKIIYNGNYLIESDQVDNFPPSNLIVRDVLGSMCSAEWDEPTSSGVIGYNVYVNEELIEENITDTHCFFNSDFNSVYIVKVSAVYPNNIESVRIAEYVITGGVGIDNLENNETIIYPNPASDYVIIEYEKEINTVTIFNSSGKKVYETKNVGTNILRLEVNSYTRGIYYIDVDGRVEKMVKM